MKTSTLARPLALHRPWPQRAAEWLHDRGMQALQSARHAIARLEQAHRVRQEHDALRELDAATLRDLGAPPWLQSQAQDHRDTLRLERELLSIRGGVDPGRGL